MENSRAKGYNYGRGLEENREEKACAVRLIDATRCSRKPAFRTNEK